MPAPQQDSNATAANEISQEATGVSAPAVPKQPVAPTATRPSQSQPPPNEQNVTSLDERRRTKSSPLVRKIAKENEVDISQLQGSGVSGRVTKKDILQYLEQPSTP